VRHPTLHPASIDQFFSAGGTRKPSTGSWYCAFQCSLPEAAMNGLIYLIGLIVVIMFILSFLGLR
jgi:hypothetical protein